MEPTEGAIDAAALGRLPTFQGLRERDLSAAALSLSRVTLAAGQTLFEQGERGTSAYVIVSGQVQVRTGDHQLAILEPGRAFGELGLLVDRPRSATVVARDGVELLEVTREVFRAGLDRRDVWATRFLLAAAASVAENLATTNERLVALLDASGSSGNPELRDRLAEVVAATQYFAAGSYHQRVDIRGASELDALASAFNTMATAIESDVARRERAEQEAVEARAAAEEANRAKSTFLAAMSHEIRTPMIGVTGMLEVLAQTELSPEQQSMVSTAQGSAQMLLQIIGDILDFSKIEAGKLDLAPAPFAVRPLAEAAVQTFFHTASAKGLQLRGHVDERVAAAHVGDALRLRQILSNFISNSVKFTSSGSIDLTVRVVGDDGATQHLQFSVSDTGIGVAPEKQRELFQEFAQADASTAARSGGTGLGLAICRRLATLMGGEVTMDSTLGRGTTLHLTVPLAVVAPSEVDVGPASALGTALAVRRPRPTREVAEREGSVLLLAEDHPINRRVLVHQLDIIGFHVDAAEDGQKALERFTRGTYGLVLTDLNMPVMDGFQLAHAIRSEEARAGRPRTPIVALSANVMQGEADKCAGAGMDDFVGKPTSMPVLADTLRRWLPHLQWPGVAAPVSAPADEDRTEERGVIDGRALLEVTGGDEELAAALLADFVDSSAADLAALHAAVADANADEVRRQAHRIKGASRSVGAQEVAALADRLEAAAATAVDDWSSLRSTVESLRAAVARVAAAPRSFR